MRQIIITILIITVLASLRADNVRLAGEVRNLKGVVHDQAVTLFWATHPRTIQERTLDYIMSRGEFQR